MKRLILCLVLIALCLSPVISEENKNQRPEKWAKPISMEGLPNLHKVSDTLYRSAQPEKDGIENLKKMGIRTIVCLRHFHSDESMIKGKGFNYVSIPMKTWSPERKDAVKFLKTVTDPANAPVLVHCQHGADRTGTMCAIYRVAVEGWTKEDAIKEMTDGGYNYHSIWTNLPPWIKELDIDSVKKEAGIGALGKN